MAARAITYPEARQINITVPESLAGELEDISSKLGRNMQDLMVFAFGLLKIYVDAQTNRQKLLLVDERGKPIQEIVFR